MSLSNSENHEAWDAIDEAILIGQLAAICTDYIELFESAKKVGREFETIVLPLDSSMHPAGIDEKAELYKEKLKEGILERLAEAGYIFVPTHYEFDNEQNPIGVCYMVSW